MNNNRSKGSQQTHSMQELAQLAAAEFFREGMNQLRVNDVHDTVRSGMDAIYESEMQRLDAAEPAEGAIANLDRTDTGIGMSHDARRKQFIALCNEAIARIGEADPNDDERLADIPFKVLEGIERAAEAIGCKGTPLRVNPPDRMPKPDDKTEPEVVEFLDPYGEDMSIHFLSWLHTEKERTSRVGFGQGSIAKVRQRAVTVLRRWIRHVEANVIRFPTENERPTGPAVETGLQDMKRQTVKTAIANDEQFTFAPDGDGYYVAGFHESGHVKRLKGFDNLARLIQTPRIPVTMLELIGVAEEPRIVNDQRSWQSTLDEEGLSKARNALAELNVDREKFQRDNDSVNLDVTETQIADLETQIRAAVGKKGRVRNLNSNPDKMRPTISANLNRAYAKLRAARPSMTELANHFASAISSEGATFVYNPLIEVKWANSRKSNL